MIFDPKVIAMLLEMSDNDLDVSMKPLIEKWSTPPKAIEILEVLDHCIHGALASGFIVTLLTCGYEDACKLENVTNDDVIKHAIWRY